MSVRTLLRTPVPVCNVTRAILGSNPQFATLLKLSTVPSRSFQRFPVLKAASTPESVAEGEITSLKGLSHVWQT